MSPVAMTVHKRRREILAWLQDRPHKAWSAEVVAKHFGLSRDVARRDLTALGKTRHVHEEPGTGRLPTMWRAK